MYYEIKSTENKDHNIPWLVVVAKKTFNTLLKNHENHLLFSVGNIDRNNNF